MDQSDSQEELSRFLSRRFHSTAGPSVEFDNGYRAWYLNGERHRTDGPAVENLNGYQEWWLHDKKFSFDQWLAQTDLPDQEKLMMVLKYG